MAPAIFVLGIIAVIVLTPSAVALVGPRTGPHGVTTRQARSRPPAPGGGGGGRPSPPVMKSLDSLQHHHHQHQSGSQSRLSSSPSPDSSTSSSSSSSSSQLWVKVDAWGQSFKPQARQTAARAALEEHRGRKLRLMLQSCFYYTLFIIYRGYRGFFVICPAVFREVYRKLNAAVDNPFVDDDQDRDVVVAAGDDPHSRLTSSWRARLTISVLATVVTISYVLGGLLRVILKAGSTLTQTSSLTQSLQQAAQEQEGLEEKMLRYSSSSSSSSSSSQSSSSPSAPNTWRKDDDNNNKKSSSSRPKWLKP